MGLGADMVGPLFEFDVRVTGDEAEVAGRALQLIPHPVPGILGALEQHGGETSGGGAEAGP